MDINPWTVESAKVVLDEAAQARTYSDGEKAPSDILLTGLVALLILELREANKHLERLVRFTR